MRCASVHTDGAGGRDWTHSGRSVPSGCWAALGSREPASSNPPAEAPVKVLPCTYLLDLERYPSIGCGRGLIWDWGQSLRGEARVSRKMGTLIGMCKPEGAVPGKDLTRHIILWRWHLKPLSCLLCNPSCFKSEERVSTLKLFFLRRDAKDHSLRACIKEE